MRSLSQLSIIFASATASLAAERDALTLNQALALATSRSPELAAAFGIKL